jgi:hypothetical protein
MISPYLIYIKFLYITPTKNPTLMWDFDYAIGLRASAIKLYLSIYTACFMISIGEITSPLRTAFKMEGEHPETRHVPVS